MPSVGSKVPSVGGLEFVKGEAVSVPSPGSVLVLESWATW